METRREECEVPLRIGGSNDGEDNGVNQYTGAATDLELVWLDCTSEGWIGMSNSL